NICRSPMAEAVFTAYAKKLNLNFTIDSCGTAGYHVGENPDSRSVAECKRNGVPVNHKARQLTKSDFTNFDYILVMDHDNKEDVQSVKPQNCTAKICLFGEFDPENDLVIKDPYYGGRDGFEKNFRQVTRCSEGFIKYLQDNKEI
ncbi:hypothetical protein HDV01_002501, partial [Terramyces sp. JEL0728]